MNISDLYCWISSLKRGISLSKALGQRGMVFKGEAHSGLDDAYNTALLFLDLIKK